jgi:signal transduction histidine kinase
MMTANVCWGVMAYLIEIRVVIAVAVVMVLGSLLLNGFAAFGKHARRDNIAFIWLTGTNLAFLTGTGGLLLAPFFPFWLSAFLVIAGMLFGLLIGYVALSVAIGDSPRAVRWLAIGAVLGAGQGALAMLTGNVESLIVSSSVVNGIVCLGLARRLWARSRQYGVELALLASAPFYAIGLAYVARLVVIGMQLGEYALAVGTLLITLLMAFSALQWSFALLAFRAARLNQHLNVARDKAEQASTLKTRLLANMSHELRTPLNGVLGMAQALRPNMPDQRNLEMLDTMAESAQVLMGRLNDILDHSALQSGSLTIRRTPFDLRALVIDATSGFQADARAKGLVVDVSFDPSCHCWWQGDYARLSQILRSLLQNAVTYTDHGTIIVTVAQQAGGVSIRVADTGIGMTDAQQRVVFEAFAQADVSVTRRADGAGLGLAIVRGLAEAMGGRLTLSSAPDAGSTFSLELPLAVAVPQMDKPKPAAPAQPRLTKVLDILVAEDNKVNQRVLTALMKDSGARLTIVENGVLAVAQSAQHDFDLFLFDIMMPEMDGVTAFLQIKAQKIALGKPVPPAVAITANVSSEQLHEYSAAGFVEVLPKPIRKPDLLTALGRHT